LINTTSFSAVSSFSLPANTFSATYENYYYIMNATNTATATLIARMRTGGADNSTSNYGKIDVNLSAGSLTAADNTAQTSWTAIAHSTSGAMTFGHQGVLFSPFETKATGLRYDFLSQFTGTQFLRLGYARFNGTTSFDSMSWIIDAGTMTGSMSVYGLAK
jgi:hypothetical protein